MIVLNREEFKILIPQGKSNDNPSKDNPLPNDDGQKQVNFDESEIDKVKDWDEIKKELEDIVGEENSKGSEDGDEDKEKKDSGEEEGEGKKNKEGEEESSEGKSKKDSEESEKSDKEDGDKEGEEEESEKDGDADSDADADADKSEGDSAEEVLGSSEKDGEKDGEEEAYEETADEKTARLKRKAIKDHNIIVNSLNKVKEFYVKNEKIMSDSVKGKFTKKIEKLESIVEESLKIINK